MNKFNFFNSKGVTLIELSIVIAILAIVMGAVFNFLATGVLISGNINKDLDIQQDARLIMQQISQDLRSATEVNITESGQKISIDTNADKDYEIEYNLANNQLTRYYSGKKDKVWNNIQSNSSGKAFTSDPSNDCLTTIDLKATKDGKEIQINSTIFLKTKWVNKSK